MSVFMVLIALSLITSKAIASSMPSAPMPLLLRMAHQERGLLAITFDPSKSAETSLEVVNTNKQGGYHPQWIKKYDDKLYTMSRTSFPDNTSVSGGIFAFQDQPAGPYRSSSEKYALQLLDEVSSNGKGGVYVDVSPDGRTLSAANIDGSTVSIHPLSRNGLVGHASYIFQFELPNPNDPALHPGTNGSQLAANPHEAIFEPSGEYLFVPGRGSDRLYVFRINGPHDVQSVQNITLPPGTGPRHITFQIYNCTRTFAYLVSELDNTVRVFTLDGVSNDEGYDNPSHRSRLIVELVQVASTLAPGSGRTLPNNNQLPSEVAVTNDGRFLYAANRNAISYASDTLSIFAIHADSESQHLELLGKNATYGKIPRHFSLSRDAENKYVAIGNEVSNDLTVLERDPASGAMIGIVGKLTLGAFDRTQNKGPTCVVWE